MLNTEPLGCALVSKEVRGGRLAPKDKAPAGWEENGAYVIKIGIHPFGFFGVSKIRGYKTRL